MVGVLLAWSDPATPGCEVGGGQLDRGKFIWKGGQCPWDNTEDVTGRPSVSAPSSSANLILIPALKNISGS